MPVRMTGMISGMDTESLIKGMVDAQRMKNKRVEDKSTLLEWKQDKWKELNKKLYKLYTDDLSKMRLQGNYKAKKVSSSNENLVTVTGGVNAPEGSHKLEIKQLASSQYVTSGEIKTDKNDNATTLSTKLKDLGVNAGTLINFSTSGKTKTLEVTETTTIEDFVSTAKNVGLNANFDINQGRFFISSKNSGKANEFDITATTSTATAPKNEIKDLIGYSTLSSADKAKADSAFAILGNETSTADEVNSATDTLATLARYKIVDGQIRGEITQTAIDDEEAAIKAEVMQKEIELIKEKARQEGILTKEEIENINENTINDTEKARIQGLQDEKVAASTARINAAVEKKVAEAIVAEKKNDQGRYTYIQGSNPDVDAANVLAISKAATYREEALKPQTDASDQLVPLKLDAGQSKVVPALDSIIKYNEVELTNSSNLITVNGLTMTLKGAAVGETINLNVSNNTQETYDMVKKFIKSYNDIIKEMNDLYYAPSAKGYKPLSDDEKQAMTDGQIEKWEKKIQDSILRRDSTLESVLNSMKSAMMTRVEVGGKSYSLASFGIQTSSDYTEKGLLHIYGDKDDGIYSAMDDKLMKALEEDPETVTEVLSKVSMNLYETMGKKMSSIPNVRSAYTFYNDKTMAKEQMDYKKQIAILESKLTAMENKYYKQFSAMETTLAKLQQQTNALTGMLGMKQQ